MAKKNKAVGKQVQGSSGGRHRMDEAQLAQVMAAKTGGTQTLPDQITSTFGTASSARATNNKSGHKTNKDKGKIKGGKKKLTGQQVAGLFGNNLGTGNKPTSPTYTAPEAYSSQYSGDVSNYLSKLTNRESFSYDPLKDASYQALAKVYNARGNLAARDTMGDAANLNGGYGSSYATTAAAQARNQYNQELASYIPQLEQNAYDRYVGDYEMNLSTLGALQDADDTMYGRYRDTVADNQWLYGMDYQKYRDDVADRQWNKEFKLEKRDAKAERKLTRAKTKYTRKQTKLLKSKSSGSSGGGGRRSSGGSGGSSGGGYYRSSGSSSSSSSGGSSAGSQAVADLAKNVGAWALGQYGRLGPKGPTKPKK